DDRGGLEEPPHHRAVPEHGEPPRRTGRGEEAEALAARAAAEEAEGQVGARVSPASQGVLTETFRLNHPDQDVLTRAGGYFSARCCFFTSNCRSAVTFAAA